MKAINAKSTDLNKEVATAQVAGEKVNYKGARILLVTTLLGAVKSIYTPKYVINRLGKVIKTYKELEIQRHDCVRKTNLSEDTVSTMIDANIFPGKFSHPKYCGVWSNMTEKQRLEWHLSQISEGNPFSYEVIN